MVLQDVAVLDTLSIPKIGGRSPTRNADADSGIRARSDCARMRGAWIGQLGRMGKVRALASKEHSALGGRAHRAGLGAGMMGMSVDPQRSEHSASRGLCPSYGCALRRGAWIGQLGRMGKVRARASKEHSALGGRAHRAGLGAGMMGMSVDPRRSEHSASRGLCPSYGTTDRFAAMRASSVGWAKSVLWLRRSTRRWADVPIVQGSASG
ncbi:hypothetical protein CKO23_03235 [Thiocystis violacea]|nr:hypothetical protein [Thiocystis violacea]